MKRVICSSFANGQETISKEDLNDARVKLLSVVDEMGVSSLYQSIDEQLEDALSWDVEEYKRSDFSGAVNNFLRFFLTEEDPLGTYTKADEEDDYSPYGGKMNVSSITGPFGELVGNDRYFSDGQEEAAIRYWLEESKKYPTCTSIDGLKYQGDNIHKWVIDNGDKFREMCKETDSPYVVDYLVDGCRRPCRQSDKYPDQIYPFSLG